MTTFHMTNGINKQDTRGIVSICFTFGDVETIYHEAAVEGLVTLLDSV